MPSLKTIKPTQKDHTMRAYQWNGPGSGLVLKDIPIPQPSTGEVQIQIKACGLCHSDCHTLNGVGAQWIKKRPITLGHEVSAQITALGEGVTDFHIDQRVAVALIQPATAIGLDFDGGYAEYAVTPAHTLVPIPDSLSFELACVAVDSIVTAYHAVVVTAKVTSSMTVGIIGLGGLGSVGLRFACLQGATVYGVDTNVGKFEAAMSNGAKGCRRNLVEIEDVTFDIILDFVGIRATMLAALDAVKREGRIVLVGMEEPDMNLPVGLIVMKNIEIRGSLGGRKEELQTIFELIDTGKLVPVIEEVPFLELNDTLKRMDEGKTNARMYVRPNSL